ncbi:MAG: ERF family protein [Pseudomonadota bacterium]
MADGMHEPQLVGEPIIEMSAEIDAFAKAFVAAQKEMTTPKKDAANPFFKSKYADLNQVLQGVQPALNAAGISIMQHPASDNGDLRLTTMLLHESGQWMRSTLRMKPTDDKPQTAGSCITYARRYGLQSIACVGAEDDDGNAASARADTRSAPQEPKQSARLTKQNARDLYSDLQTGLRETENMESQVFWYKANSKPIKTLPQDWEDNLVAEMRERAKAYEEPMAAE